jgi:hypothetical protein
VDAQALAAVQAFLAAPAQLPQLALTFGLLALAWLVQAHRRQPKATTTTLAPRPRPGWIAAQKRSRDVYVWLWESARGGVEWLDAAPLPLGDILCCELDHLEARTRGEQAAVRFETEEATT